MNSTPNETSTTVSGPGQRLRQARENIKLSLDEVAKKLRLSRVQVLAIEKDDYSYVSALAYAKGHLRMYASLVGLPTYEILKAFDALGLQGDAAGQVPQTLRIASIINEREKKSAPGSWRLAVVVLAMIILIAGLVIWEMGRHRLAPVTAAATTPSAPILATTLSVASTPIATPPAVMEATTAPVTTMPGSAGDKVVPLTLPPDANSSVTPAADARKLNAEMPIHRARPVDQDARAPQGTDTIRE
jgi:cytoskeleton protein RodZ